MKTSSWLAILLCIPLSSCVIETKRDAATKKEVTDKQIKWEIHKDTQNGVFTQSFINPITGIKYCALEQNIKDSAVLNFHADSTYITAFGSFKRKNRELDVTILSYEVLSKAYQSYNLVMFPPKEDTVYFLYSDVNTKNEFRLNKIIPDSIVSSSWLRKNNFFYLGCCIEYSSTLNPNLDSSSLISCTNKLKIQF